MTADHYIRHAGRFGADGVLESASGELSEAEYAELLRRLAGATDGSAATRCACPGCFAVFVPARKGRIYCSAGCRQKAHRLRRGASSRFAVGRSKPF